MSTPEERNAKIEEVRELLEVLAGIEPTSLGREKELSPDINFKEAIPSFEQMLDIIKQLQQRDISRLSYSQITNIFKACSILKNLIDKVNAFIINQNTPADVCTGIINEVKNSYDSVMDPLIIPLAFTATQSTDYAKIEREAKGYHATMAAEAEKFKTLIDDNQVEANKALSAVKEQAAEAGVANNAQIFIMESKEHEKMAKIWVIATIIMAGVTLCTSVGFLIASVYYIPTTTPIAIQYVVSKLIVLSTLSFGIFWCARNYKSSKHNQTLNKHRANALSTFRAFVEGSEDPTVKDAILMQTSLAAFTNRSTGYDSGEKESQTINPVVEILGKSITKVDSIG